MTVRRTSTLGMGSNIHTVVIKELIPEKNLAICEEVSTKQSMTIPVFPMRSRAGVPRVGETWIIDYALGIRSFAALLATRRPVITGTAPDTDTVLYQVLKALEAVGLVIDQTE